MISKGKETRDRAKVRADKAPVAGVSSNRREMRGGAKESAGNIPVAKRERVGRAGGESNDTVCCQDAAKQLERNKNNNMAVAWFLLKEV